MVRKYACDVVTSEDQPLRVIDKHSGRVVVYDQIERVGEDKLFFAGYFEDNGDPVEKTLDFDSQLTVESDLTS